MKKNFHPKNDILGFMAQIREFPLIQRKIISYLTKRREATKEQLIASLDEEAEAMKDALSSLVAKKILYRESFNNVELFSMDLLNRGSIYKETFPSGPIIPLVFQFNLLSDSQRLAGFTEAIRKTVQEGDFVLDIGAGSGVLSIMAAEKARHVHSIEIDPLVALHCKYFTNRSGFARKIKVFNQNVMEFKSSAKADVVICEMLDTALMAELQVTVMNYVLENLLKPGGKVIPYMAETSVALIHKDFTFNHQDFKLPHFEAYGSRKSDDVLSEPFAYHTISFYDTNSDHLDKTFSIETNKKGIANGLRITTDTHLTEKIVLGGSDWLNPPLILPFDDMKIEKHDNITVKIKYRLGGGINSVEYSCEKE